MSSYALRSRALVVVACLAATVAAPGAALAQSAGNDQYQDPLAGTTTAPPPTSTPQLTPTAGTGSGSSGTAGTTRTSKPASTKVTPTQATSTSLPNTGVDGRIVAALGAGLLLCGAGLRLRTARERF